MLEKVITCFYVHSSILLLDLGCGFVRYKSRDSALKAITALNGAYKLEVCLYLLYINCPLYFVFYLFIYCLFLS